MISLKSTRYVWARIVLLAGLLPLVPLGEARAASVKDVLTALVTGDTDLLVRSIGSSLACQLTRIMHEA